MAEELTTTGQPEIQDRVVHIGRVVKVVKGGRRFSFNALVVCGDGAGHVGYGLGKASEVPEAIGKAAAAARKNLITAPIVDRTIPHPVSVKFGASKVIMLPAKKGAGIIAGGCVRAVVELAGYQDVVAKCHGSSNPHNLLKAAFNGLRDLNDERQVRLRRGLEAEVPSGAASSQAVPSEVVSSETVSSEEGQGTV